MSLKLPGKLLLEYLALLWPAAPELEGCCEATASCVRFLMTRPYSSMCARFLMTRPYSSMRDFFVFFFRMAMGELFAAARSSPAG